jgi:hypothetical protein
LIQSKKRIDLYSLGKTPDPSIEILKIFFVVFLHFLQEKKKNFRFVCCPKSTLIFLGQRNCGKTEQKKFSLMHAKKTPKKNAKEN